VPFALTGMKFIFFLISEEPLENSKKPCLGQDLLIFLKMFSSGDAISENNYLHGRKRKRRRLFKIGSTKMSCPYAATRPYSLASFLSSYKNALLVKL
jgi:hypothetical protein